MFTEVSLTAATARQGQTIQESAVSPSYDAQESSAPWEYNTAIESVVGTFVYAVVTNVKGQRAPESRPPLTGAAPGVGESHFVFLSDYFDWYRREGTSDVHEPAERGGRESPCAQLVTEWRQLKCDWSNGYKSRVARQVPGCVARMAVGGVGGRRIFGMAPDPAPWSARADVACDRRIVRGLPFDFVDVDGDAGDKPAKRQAVVPWW